MTTKAPKKSATMSFLDSLVGEALTLGSLLQTIRETDELSQAELAARLGVSKSHLCDIEKGRKAVSPERASRFALELGYSEEQFVRLALQQMIEAAGLDFQVGLTHRGRTPKLDLSARTLLHSGLFREFKRLLAHAESLRLLKKEESNE